MIQSFTKGTHTFRHTYKLLGHYNYSDSCCETRQLHRFKVEHSTDRLYAIYKMVVKQSHPPKCLKLMHCMQFTEQVNNHRSQTPYVHTLSALHRAVGTTHPNCLPQRAPDMQQTGTGSSVSRQCANETRSTLPHTWRLEFAESQERE